MRIYKNFLISRKGCPKVVYGLISTMGLGRIGHDHLTIEARTGETLRLWRIAVLVGLCRAFGLKRTPRGEPGTYGLDMARDYEQADFVASDLLLVGGQPKHQIKDERDNDGRLLLSQEFTQGLRLGSVWNWTVVSDVVRQMLEGAELIGLQFREAVTRSGGGKGGRFWELQSSIVLPKMANTNHLMYCGYRETPPQPFTGDYSRMVFIDDPPYRSGEIHYRRSDLVPLGKFDIARTFELYRQPHPELVISQRFYQTCFRNGISLNLEPVRVDAC